MQGQQQKRGLCPFTLDKVALGVGLHIVSYCIAVSAHAASHVVGCCMRVAAAHAALCIVGYYEAVTACVMLCAILGMLSQFACCISDAAATVMAAPAKFPKAKSRGLAHLLFPFSFPKGKLKII